MTLSNTPTGREASCSLCGAHVEEVRLLHGRYRGKVWHGVLRWRTLDAGHSSTRCGHDPDGAFHDVRPNAFTADARTR